MSQYGNADRRRSCRGSSCSSRIETHCRLCQPGVHRHILLPVLQTHRWPVVHATMGAPSEADQNGGSSEHVQVTQAHGQGFCSASWCKIGGEDGSRPVWCAVTAGQDGKLVLRKGEEALGVVKVSGDHDKSAHCLAVSEDGRTVATVDDSYVQVRHACCALSDSAPLPSLHGGGAWGAPGKQLLAQVGSCSSVAASSAWAGARR